MSTTVLVVEDDLEINELIGEYLALENIHYLQAASGQAGIHAATARHPDAIILDLMLPDIDGFEVARTVTNHRATFDIPVVILSCMCQDTDREKGFVSGALHFMRKPFLPDDLLLTLRRALEWKSTLRTRAPSGEVLMGNGDRPATARSLHEMIADLFVHTDLSDDAVAGIREAVNTLDQWTRQWNQDKSQHSQLKLEYRIQAPARNPGSPNGPAPISNGTPSIEWRMTEDRPGVLADAFFKSVSPTSPGSSASPVSILGGWAAGTVVAKSPSPPADTLDRPALAIAPPTQWLQLLARTGATRFEKDSKSQSVRFTRVASAASFSANATVVPVVEIDGLRYPNRLREEARAAKPR